jgi:hypothetical protein
MAECCLLLRQRQPHFVHPKLSLVQLALQEETLHLHPLQPLNFTARLQKFNMEHALSVAAFDAAIELARRGRFLLSEALTIRGRALVGRAGEGVGGGSGLHWDKREGKQQLSEVMGRMQGPREPLERLLS